MKPELDETDAEILRLLVEDGRMPYTEIAEEVDMSSPSVIERVDRLRDIGVIEGFEARLDHSVLDGGHTLVRFKTSPDRVTEVTQELKGDERVETVFGSADGTVTAILNADPSELADLTTEFNAHDYCVEVIVKEEHEPTVGVPSFAPDCVECGNTVDEEGVSTRIREDVYHFCCTSCESAFKERYESITD